MTERQHRRLPVWDYRQPGLYFVTIVAAKRLPRFGRVDQVEVRLTAAGRVVEEEWSSLSLAYPSVRLDAFVLMPDHLHGILDFQRSDHGGLSEAVRRFKARSTRRVNLAAGSQGRPLWQRSFYERIIRGEGELARLRDYIAGNPARWAMCRARTPL